MIHASTTSLKFGCERSTREHLLVLMIDISLLCIRHLLGHSELCLIGQVLELFTLAFLVFSFHYVGIDVGCELCKQVFSILFGTLVHFGEG